MMGEQVDIKFKIYLFLEYAWSDGPRIQKFYSVGPRNSGCGFMYLFYNYRILILFARACDKL